MRNAILIVAMLIVAIATQQPAEAISSKAKANIKKGAGIVLIPVRVAIWGFFLVATAGAVSSGYVGFHLENALGSYDDPPPPPAAPPEPEIIEDKEDA